MSSQIILLLRLFRCFNIALDKNWLTQEVMQHPYPHSPILVSDILYSLRIPSMLVKLELNDLHNIPLSAVAYFHETLNTSVIVENVENNFVSYWQPKYGYRKEEIDLFCNKWSGQTVLTSFDGNYYRPQTLVEYHKQGIRRKAAYIICSILLFISLISVGFVRDFHLSDFLFFLLKLAGLCISLALFSSQERQIGGFLHKLCQLSVKVNCNSILQSKGAYLFNKTISFSEIGVLYFGSGLISLVLGYLVGNHTSSTLIYISWLTLPYTFFSFYYQWQIAKVWCPLCLGVLLVLWAEALIGFFLVESTFNAQNISIILIAFVLMIFFWERYSFQRKQAIKQTFTQKNLNFFKSDTRLFSFMLSQQNSISFLPIEGELVLGNPKSENHLLMATSLSCTHCTNTYTTIESLLWEFGDNLKITIRFATSSNATLLLIANAHGCSSEDIMQLLISWQKKKSQSDWESKYDKPYSFLINQSLANQVDWASKCQIEGLPAFFINGKSLPLPFTIHDVKYYYRTIID